MQMAQAQVSGPRNIPDVKVLKRRCQGVFKLEHLFHRIFLDLAGHRLFVWQPPDVA